MDLSITELTNAINHQSPRKYDHARKGIYAVFRKFQLWSFLVKSHTSARGPYPQFPKDGQMAPPVRSYVIHPFSIYVTQVCFGGICTEKKESKSVTQLPFIREPF